MDVVALYLITQTRALCHLYETGKMPAVECWRQVFIVQMKVRESIDNPDNTLEVPEQTRELCSQLHKELLPYGDNATFEQRMMMLSAFIREEILRCVGAKFIWPHTYDADALKMLGFHETNVQGFYQVPYYLIDHLSRDSLLFFMDGQWTTTIERSEPLDGFGPDQNGMMPLGMYALGEMPERFRHNFFMETE